MTIQLDSSYSNQHPLLKDLLMYFADYQSLPKSDEEEKQQFVDNVIRKALGETPSVASFDHQVGTVLPAMFHMDKDQLFKGMLEFFALQSFLYTVRKHISVMTNQPWQENVLKAPQKRIVTPGKEAYDMMGNNLLDIKESRDGYSLIFD